MTFESPATVDYRNVRALNRAYLSLLQTDRHTQQSLLRLAPQLIRRITSLTRHQVERLSATPFLLLSFREGDDKLWSQILAEDADRDLFANAVADDLDRLRSAGLGFVWQLARQNPYTLRLICGASLHWCEQIAERTVFGLLSAAAPHADLVELRRAGDAELWWRLLDDGICRETDIRMAAHMSVMQTVLTRPEGQALALELVATADVVVENLRPGTAEKLGIGWDAIHRTNARAVMLSISGFGHDSSWRDRGAYAPHGSLELTLRPHSASNRALPLYERASCSVSSSMWMQFLSLAPAQATARAVTSTVVHPKSRMK